jgi:AcrR family transcriptional regulator
VVTSPREAGRPAQILAAAIRVIARGGTARLTLSAVAAEANVSRPTLYRWFPSKELLLGAIAGYEVERFDTGLEQVVTAQNSSPRKLEAALRFIVSYLDREEGVNPIGTDPAFALQSLADTIDPHVGSVSALLGDALDEVPAVRGGALTRQQAVEMFLRVAYSHYLIPHRDTAELLEILRSFAGLAGRRPSADKRPEASTA